MGKIGLCGFDFLEMQSSYPQVFKVFFHNTDICVGEVYFRFGVLNVSFVKEGSEITVYNEKLPGYSDFDGQFDCYRDEVKYLEIAANCIIDMLEEKDIKKYFL